MSLSVLFIEGFDSYGSSTTTLTRKWEHTQGNMAVGPTYGRLGSNGWASRSAGSGGVVRKTLASSLGVVGAMAAYNPTTFAFSAGGAVIFELQDVSTNVQTAIIALADGSITAKTGNSQSATLGTSAPGVLVGSAFVHVEAQVLVDPFVGTVDVWVDGTNVLSLTGKDTRGASSSAPAVSFLQLGDASVAGTDTYFDDVVFYDAASRSAGERFGDQRIQTLLPIGTGSETVGSWTQVGGTGGNTWTAVNETPDDGDASYQAAATTSDLITFQMADLATNPATVTAVACNMIVRKDDATSRQAATVIRTGTADQVGGTINVPSSYADFQTISVTDPSTSAAWTVSGVNAINAGLLIIS